MPRVGRRSAAKHEKRRAGPMETVAVSATEAKNEFGRILETAMRGGRVVITKHESPKAVLISVEEFDVLANAHRAELEALRGEFDQLLARMQTPAARAAMDSAFHATPKDLGKAAVAAARRHA
jgi:antitoxin Phd